MVAALGLEHQLVGISHECDFPHSIRQVPVMIEPLVEAAHTTSSGIDQRVKDLVATVRQLRAAGVEVVLDTETYPNGRFADLVDPEGNPIQLWQASGADAD